MNMSYLENVVTSNNQLLILAQQFGQLFHLLLNYLENVASSDTTLELCLTSGETFLAPLKSYIAAEISGNALWGALVRGTRILVSTVNAIFVLNFLKIQVWTKLHSKESFGGQNLEWNICWRMWYHLKCALQCLIKCEWSAKSAFFIFQIFSAFSESLLQRCLKFAKTEIRIELQ